VSWSPLKIAADRHDDHAKGAARRHARDRDLGSLGGPRVTCASPAAGSAGRSCCATCGPRRTGSPPSRSSAKRGCGSASSCSGPGRSSSTPATAQNSSAAFGCCAAKSSRSCAVLRQGAALPLDARAGAQPAQDRAGAVDLRRAPRDRTDQQPRRTRPSISGHLPQAQPRQPIQRRRATHRPPPVRAHHLPTAAPQPARLPHRPDRRPHARPPLPRSAPNATKH